jgi:nucleotide-binding universal stress UspA family protein
VPIRVTVPELEAMRILVGSDLSGASDEALRQARSFARLPGAKLAVCHVLPEAQLPALFPQEHERDTEALSALEPRIVAALRAQVERLADGQETQFEVFVEQGSNYAELVDRAEKWRADLIVVGNHGRAGLKHFFLSSVAEQVARHAPCTALIARTHGDGAVLVATDLSDPAQLALEAGAREAVRRKRPLVVLHATDSLARRSAPAMSLLGVNPTFETAQISEERNSLARQIIDATLRRLGTVADVHVVSGDPATEILRLAEALPAELLVLGTRGRTGVSRIMLGGVAASMVQSATCSVLAVRAGPGGGFYGPPAAPAPGS